MSPYELVDSEKAAFPVAVLCEVVGVSRSAYYAWRRSVPSQREQANERILAEIRAIHVENETRYALTAIRLGEKGLVIRVGLPQWAQRLKEPQVAQVTRNIIDLLRGQQPKIRTLR